jgi:hypothetical protein
MAWGSRRQAEEITREVRAAVADAASLAAVSTALAAHMSTCERDKAEIKKTLADQDTERIRMHSENLTELAKIHDRINGLSWKIMMMVIGAQGVIILAVVGALYTIFARKMGGP